MSEPLAYLNGKLIPAHEALIPVYDAGFVQGTTVAEQLRTFRHRLFHLDEHLERLEHSLAILGLASPCATDELAELAHSLIEHNAGLIDAGDDLGLAIFVTPGPYRALAMRAPPGTTIGMHTTPLAFRLWADKYAVGESLAETSIMQVPGACWPPELKVRSRVHYYLADREATARVPGARAIMLDKAGFVTETTTANLLIVRDGSLESPPPSKILPGVSLAYVRRLASELAIPYRARDLRPSDLAIADEVLICSTSGCLLPATKFNGAPIGDGRPGAVFTRLLAAWGESVGVDIAAQAAKFANR